LHVLPTTVGLSMKYVILDEQGRRMVLPRETEGEAIGVIARAVAGRDASPLECTKAWERLRGRGYRVVRASELAAITRRVTEG
jgi:hypothetical protein